MYMLRRDEGRAAWNTVDILDLSALARVTRTDPPPSGRTAGAGTVGTWSDIGCSLTEWVKNERHETLIKVF